MTQGHSALPFPSDAHVTKQAISLEIMQMENPDYEGNQGRYITIQSFNAELINLAVGLMIGISSKSKDNSLSYEYN